MTETAGVARMTLYNNFSSKEALTAVVYAELAEATLREFRAFGSTERPEETRISALFDYFDGHAHGAEYRGCPFILASQQAAEANGPIFELVHSYKCALREHVLELLDDSRANRSELADQIVILLDGAVIGYYLKGVANPGTSAKRAVNDVVTRRSRRRLPPTARLKDAQLQANCRRRD